MSTSTTQKQIVFTENEKNLGRELKNVAKILEISAEEQTKFANNLVDLTSTEREKVIRNELIKRLGDCASQPLDGLIQCSQNYQKQDEDLRLKLNEFLTRASSAEKETFMNLLKTKTDMKSRIAFLQEQLKLMMQRLPQKDHKKLWIGVGVGTVIVIGIGTFWFTRKRKTSV